MDKLISADALCSTMKDDSSINGANLRRVIQHINDAPAVEEVHGYWIERPLDNFRKYEVKCSECGFIGVSDYDQYLEPIDFYFCPRCGTRMDGLDGDGNG